MDYAPFGEPASKGALPGTQEYTPDQWNAGDALDGLGLTVIGARVYDPVIGRFLSRDPIVSPRTSSAANPYAFSFGDPVNVSDPSGLDPCPDQGNCISYTYDPDGSSVVGGLAGLALEGLDALYNSIHGSSSGSVSATALWLPAPASMDVWTRNMVPCALADCSDISPGAIRLNVNPNFIDYDPFPAPPIYDASGPQPGITDVPLSVFADIGILALSVAAWQPEGAAAAYAELMGWSEGEALTMGTKVATSAATATTDAIDAVDAAGAADSALDAVDASGALDPLQLGRDAEANSLSAQNLTKNTTVWRPTAQQIDSAAFKVIVGDAKYTASGLPRGVILDSVDRGLIEMKAGRSVLRSTYQLRLQTFRSVVEGSSFTIQTTRPISIQFGQWLNRWGVAIEPMP